MTNLRNRISEARKNTNRVSNTKRLQDVLAKIDAAALTAKTFDDKNALLSIAEELKSGPSAGITFKAECVFFDASEKNSAKTAAVYAKILAVRYAGKASDAMMLDINDLTSAKKLATMWQEDVTVDNMTSFDSMINI